MSAWTAVLSHFTVVMSMASSYLSSPPPTFFSQACRIPTCKVRLEPPTCSPTCTALELPSAIRCWCCSPRARTWMSRSEWSPHDKLWKVLWNAWHSLRPMSPVGKRWWTLGHLLVGWLCVWWVRRRWYVKPVYSASMTFSCWPSRWGCNLR